MGEKVTIDSRKVERGDVFIAIRGGVNFVDDALRRGAKLCVVPYSCPTEGERVLRVPDTLRYLRELAEEKRARFTGKVVGITGSAGKTTCKEMLVYALKSVGRRVSYSFGNYNNLIGVPVSLLEADLESDCWVFELGTNAIGEISQLTKIVKPEISIITNIYPSHLKGLGNLESVAKEKSSIAEFAHSTIIPIRFYWQIYSFLTNRKVFWALPSKRDFVLPGEHFKELLGIVESVGQIMGLNFDRVGWNRFSFPKGRFNIIKKEAVTLIDDSYNANPGSVKASLSALKEMSFKGEIGIVLADMLELGKEELKYHQDIVAFVQYLFPEARKVFIGSIFKEAVYLEQERGALSLEQWQGCQDLIIDFLKGCSVIFFKGSHSMELFKLVEIFSDLLEEYEGN